MKVFIIGVSGAVGGLLAGNLVDRQDDVTGRNGIGTISLGPAQPHDEISRQDVAATLAELLHEPRIQRRILELTQGSTPIARAVLANVP